MGIGVNPSVPMIQKIPCGNSLAARKLNAARLMSGISCSGSHKCFLERGMYSVYNLYLGRKATSSWLSCKCDMPVTVADGKACTKTHPWDLCSVHYRCGCPSSAVLSFAGFSAELSRETCLVSRLLYSRAGVVR